MLLKDTKTNETTYFDGTDGLIHCPFADHDDTNPSCTVTLLSDAKDKVGIFSCKGAACNRSGIVVTDGQEQEFQTRNNTPKTNNPLEFWEDDFDIPKKEDTKISDAPIKKKRELDFNILLREHIYKDINGNNIKRKAYHPYKEGEGKGSPQQRWEDNKWEWGLTYCDGTKVQEILYNSHLFTDFTKKIAITEGEKDADTMTGLNSIGTTLGSANNIISGIHKKYFIYREKIGIVGDKDESGAKFIYETIKALINMGYPISQISYIDFENPDGIKGFDITDAINAGVKIVAIPITDDKLKNYFKEYEIFIEDIISPNYILKNHQNYPRCIFDEEIEDMLENVARAVSTTYSNAAHAFLPLVSYLVCDSYMFQEGSFCSCLTLNSALIAVSGKGKSNAYEFFLPKLEEITRDKIMEYNESVVEYLNNKEEAKEEKADCKKKNKKYISKPNPEPKKSLATLTNITVPSLVTQLQIDNKIAIYTDELSSLLKGFDQYGSKGGNEKDEVMAIMDNRMISNIRKNKKGGTDVTYIEKPLVPIYGSIQWDRMELLLNDKESGFPYRFLYCVGEDKDYKLLGREESHIYESAKTDYSIIFDTLRLIRGYCPPPVGVCEWDNIEESDGIAKLSLSEEAYARWRYFIEGYFNYLSGEFNRDGINIDPLLSKMRPHFNKLIGLIHILKNYKNADDIKKEITLDTVEKAERLTMFYMTQAYKVFHSRDIKDNKNEDLDFIRIKKFMNKKGLEEITANKLRQYVFQKYDNNLIVSKLENLEKEGYLKLSKKGKSIKIKLI